MSDQVLPSLILNDSCISDKDFSLSLMGKVKDITAMPNLYVILEKEGLQNLSLTYLRGLWVLIETVSISAKEKLLNHTVASKWGDLVEWEDLAEKSLFLYWVRAKEIEAWDQFICNDSYESESSDNDEDAKDDGSQSGDKKSQQIMMLKGSLNQVDPFNLYDILNKRKDNGDDLKYPPGFTPSVINVEKEQKGGSILQLMDELVKVGQTMGYNMEGCMQNIEVIIGSQGECNVKTKMKSMELVTIKMLWNNSSFDYALSSSLGDSGGILCVWEPTLFVKDKVTSFDNFLAVIASLIDLPLDGHAYNWAHKTANKMSKLDRFLVSKGLLASFPYLLALCLNRNISDHRPILMRELSIDYGPTPFRFFHSWFYLDGFDKMVEDTRKSLATIDSNGMINLKKKLQAPKIVIKQWTNNAMKSSYKAKISIQSKLFDNDKILDHGGSNKEILSDRSLFLKQLNDINSINSLEAAQKSKVCWAIEGDENTKFFHGILNSKRSQLAIRGTLVDGV
ncbi:RNA-directed DNA polymerase, eukaryota [Tanacetum coccineum]